MDLSLNLRIGSKRGHRQLSNASLHAFGNRLPAKLCSSRHKSLTGGPPWGPIAFKLLNYLKMYAAAQASMLNTLSPLSEAWPKLAVANGVGGRCVAHATSQILYAMLGDLYQCRRLYDLLCLWYVILVSIRYPVNYFVIGSSSIQ